VAMGEDPAMLVWLDGRANKKDHPNENFAREVMELFTVGEGYYSEQDIKEAARCLSGYKIDDATGRPALTERYHDPGRKSVLGSDGVFDADAVMALLLQKQERVAIHIAEKVWQEFIAEDLSPPATQQAIYQLAAAFYHANYDLTVLLRTALLEPDFWALPNRGSLVRSPVELLVGTVRQLDLPVPDALTLVGMGRQLGEDVLDPPNVKGWKGGSAWISTQSLLAWAPSTTVRRARQLRRIARRRPWTQRPRRRMRCRARRRARPGRSRITARGWSRCGRAPMAVSRSSLWCSYPCRRCRHCRPPCPLRRP